MSKFQKTKVTIVMVAVALTTLTGCGVAKPEAAQSREKAPVEAPAETSQDTASAAQPAQAGTTKEEATQAETANTPPEEAVKLESEAAKTTQEEANAPVEPGLQTGDEWIVAEENVWLPVVDGLGHHLQMARQYFVDKDTAGAATEIRAAAQFLKDDSARLTNEADRQAVETAAKDLDKLATEVEAGKITEITGLNVVFRNAYQTDIEHRLNGLSAEVRATLSEQMGRHFDRVVEAVNDKDFQTAAAELHKGVSFLKIEEATATEGLAKDSLTGAIRDLETLADEVAQGKTTDKATLDKTLALAHHAVASHHIERSSQAQADQALKEVGYELNIAADQLELAIKQAGHPVEGESATRLEDMRALAKQLINDDVPKTSHIDQVIEGAKQELNNLEEELKSVPTAVTAPLDVTEEWVEIDANTWMPVVDKFTHHLQLAHQAFSDKDMATAAREIRESAAFLKDEEVNATSKTAETAFKTTVTDLEKLATNVEKDQVTDIKDFDAALLKAYDTDVQQRLASISAEQASPLIEWPVTYLGKAVTAFDQGDTQQATQDIFKAISFLRLEEARADGPARTALKAAIQDLEQTAKGLREEQPTSREALDKAFEQAYRALGNHHYLRATAALANKDLVSTGHELKATAHSLEQEAGGADQAYLKDLHKLADDLIDGSTPAAAEIERVMTDVGQQLEKLSQMTAAEMAQTTPSDGWVVAEGDFFIPVVNEVGQHLKAARESFLAKDNNAAALEIRAAAQVLQGEEAKPEAKSAVEAQAATAGELRELADQVEQGQVKEARQLDTAFAKAYEADVEQRVVHLSAAEMNAFGDKLGEHFDAAITALQDQDNVRAAAEIRKASAFLNLDAARASGPAKDALQEAMANLAALSIQLDNNQPLKMTDLEAAFAQVHHALSDYHQARALEAQTNNDPVEMGHELKASASHLEQALTRAGHQAERDSIQLIADLNTLADDLIAGKEPQTDQVSHIFETLGKQLEQLGQELETTVHVPSN